jgi:hypothetical protein
MMPNYKPIGDIMKKSHFAVNQSETVRASRAFLSNFIDAQNDKIATIDFISADGTVKTINGRLNVSVDVKGNGTKKHDANLLTVYKMQAASVKGSGAHNFRTIRRDSVIAVRASRVQMKLEV